MSVGTFQKDFLTDRGVAHEEKGTFSSIPLFFLLVTLSREIIN